MFVSFTCEAGATIRHSRCKTNDCINECKAIILFRGWSGYTTILVGNRTDRCHDHPDRFLDHPCKLSLNLLNRTTSNNTPNNFIYRSGHFTNTKAVSPKSLCFFYHSQTLSLHHSIACISHCCFPTAPTKNHRRCTARIAR